MPPLALQRQGAVITRWRPQNAAPAGALVKIVSDDMPDVVAVHLVEMILVWVGCT